MDVPADILTKMERYCAYQDRCLADVRKKLGVFAVSVAQADEIIRLLTANHFLDEKRYVESFIRSKMRANQWGKLKISQALWAKGIDSKIVAQHLAEIEDTDYMTMMQQTADKWRRMHKTQEQSEQKLMQYLLSKGYKMEEIFKLKKI